LEAGKLTDLEYPGLSRLRRAPWFNFLYSKHILVKHIGFVKPTHINKAVMTTCNLHNGAFHIAELHLQTGCIPSHEPKENISSIKRQERGKRIYSLLIRRLA
jgi:hypothetical protein